MNTPDVQTIWANGSLPVIAVPPHGELRIRLPYNAANKSWLHIGRTKPTWNAKDKYWSVPRSWLNRMSRRAVQAFGQCYVIQSFRESERCAPACWNAAGVDCSCSCLGEHHGCDGEGWFVVDEAFACRAGERQFSVRLLSEKVKPAPTSDELVAASGIQWRTYFVIGGGLVKIGRSTDVDARLRTLQTGSPEPLKLLGSIAGDSELNLHRKFDHLRVGGEWFELGPDELDQVFNLIESETN